jgi:dihydrofolate synthase/folylpolyglutamate synthase
MHPEMSNLDWFEYLKTYGSKPRLQTVRQLLKQLDDPQTSFQSIHVTGTNGKGSTTAMAASILQAAGYKTGMFTSPHLSDITESIQINGEPIPINNMDTILGLIKEETKPLPSQGFRQPTHFEALVALAYTYFSIEKIDIAVIEVGMGGRDDATNVLDSIASIITNISLEHTQWLGETLEEITENKAGILKKCTELITAVNQPNIKTLLQTIATQKQSKLTQIDTDIQITPETISLERQTFTVKTPTQTLRHITTPMLGTHQQRNAACAIAAVEAAQRRGFQITPESIHKGLATITWPGRFEVMEKDPLIILDGAKDAQAVKALVETVKEYLPNRRIYTIFGVSSDKDHHSMIQSLAEVTDQFILTEHRVQTRTAKATDLETIAEKTGKPVKSFPDVKKAIQYAKQDAKPEDVILVTGSVFLIGEAREYWHPV